MFPSPGLLKTTKAVMKFCIEHEHAPVWTNRLENLVSILERGNKSEFLGAYEDFKRAGMGSFIDWFPRPVFKNETEEYVEIIWWALLGHWDEQIKHAH